MIILAGSFRLNADKLEDAKAPIAAIVAGSRSEPGCVAYSFGHDPVEPDVVHVFEVWKDRAALDYHRQTAHMAEWRKAHAVIGMHDRRLAIYDVAGVTPNP
ncbi:MAG: antibiotic biosynthesis monooxygenase [Alphaproteobacteria bacterium]|nr:antibiotic biosynthesis monooxygenase [Alphaproteobacteria bacterium]